MNNPSPLIPQGSLLEQKNKSRARVKVAFFCVVGVHVAAILIALLAQGCRRTDQQPPVVEPQPAVPATDTNLPTIDSNAVPVALADTNHPAVTTPTTPAGLPPAVEPVTPAVTEHVVQKGDSFYTIGKKFNVTVKAIQAANPAVDPNKLQINQKLVIPAPSSGGATASPVAAVGEAAEQPYVVKAGDNLTKIAAHFGTTVNAIRKANKMTTDRIKAGDKLKIPVKAAAPTAEPAATPPPTTTPAPVPR